MQLGVSSLLFGCLQQARMLKRKPGRPPKALALAAAGHVTACWLWLQGNSDTVPTARDRGDVLQAMRTRRKPVKTTPVRALVIAAMERHAPCLLTAHRGTHSVSTSWVDQFVDQELNWSFWVSRVGASCGIACAEGSKNKPKASQKKTATAASNEGASTTTGRRRGSPPSSKNNHRIGHAVMQKTKA
eukprot:363568-Chlamydomonas_euryale.AAC.3